MLFHVNVRIRDTFFSPSSAIECCPPLNGDGTQPTCGRWIISNPAVNVGGCSSEDAMEGTSDWGPHTSVNKTVWEAAACLQDSVRS